MTGQYGVPQDGGLDAAQARLEKKEIPSPDVASILAKHHKEEERGREATRAAQERLDALYAQARKSRSARESRKEIAELEDEIRRLKDVQRATPEGHHLPLEATEKVQKAVVQARARMHGKAPHG